MIERRNKKINLVLLSAGIIFILIWIWVGANFHFGAKMPYWVGESIRNDELAIVVQMLPLIMASFVISFALFLNARLHRLLRLVAIILFGSSPSYFTWYWYLLSQFR